MKKSRILAILTLAFQLIINSVLAQGLFSANNFAKASADKNFKIISAQSEKNYKVSHLKDAIHIDHAKLYKEGSPEGVLKSSDEIARLLGSYGISNTNTLIIYDDGDNKAAGRLYWILKYMGVGDVKILQKDMKAWRDARIPLTPAPAKMVSATFVAKPDSKIFVDTKWIKDNLKNSTVTIVDVRAPKEYAGSDGKSPGHIPGAINLEWSAFNGDDGLLKTNDEISKLLKSAGINSDKTIVLYCATSIRAGLPFFVLSSLLNYPNVKVYDGAMNVWSSDSSNPIVK
jgi:thiosulfate/3-mercaptopyruvate sulfurtransferase